MIYVQETTTFSPKCCSLKGVACPYPKPNPDEVWSKSILMGLSLYGINHRIMQTELKTVIVVFDTVSLVKLSFNQVCFKEVSCSACTKYL